MLRMFHLDGLQILLHSHAHDRLVFFEYFETRTLKHSNEARLIDEQC